MADRMFPGISVMTVATADELTQPDESPSIEGWIDNLTPTIMEEVFEGETILFYTLSVRAVSEQTARAKAKAFVRVKNLFEPSRIEVTSIEGGGPITKRSYTVTVGVEK